MAIEFDGKGNIVSTTEDGVIAVKLYSLEKTLEEKDKEIERLKIELQDTKEHLGEYLHEQEEENKRLNNIINELEKWLKDNENLLIHYDYESKYDYIYVDSVLDKLQELKG